MEDLSSKITELLDNPEKMNELKAIAESLMGNKNNTAETQAVTQTDILGDIDVGSIMRAVSLLKNSSNDNRSNLLLALKPHLSVERQPRVDKAIKILRLVSLIPVFREQGILNF